MTRIDQGQREAAAVLQQRPWGASDSQVIDRYGLHWLVGFEVSESA
ncbi:hypothetical protein [Dactylosporangium sp. NPDC050588]